jgi:sugar (pentulose or hexulose) kinase
VKHDRGAIAIDFGASSVRFAAGRLIEGIIEFKVIHQEPHKSQIESGREIWDSAFFLDFCKEAAAYGTSQFQNCTIGIDTWGVDFGFTEFDNPVAPIVSYRDPSHVRVFDEFAEHRNELFQLTGVQHQPFNTIYQLIARKRFGDDTRRDWLFLPSWLAASLGARHSNDATMASTSQLFLADASGWCERAFEIAEAPMPKAIPVPPGDVLGTTSDGAQIVQVAGHDTACAIHGLGELRNDQAYISLGTWSLLGCILDEPLISAEAEESGFSNERSADGRVRFLTNVAGFYVVNRLHKELGIEMSVSEWIENATLSNSSLDLRDKVFFNPKSMVEASLRKLEWHPSSLEEWAGVALLSIARSNALQLRNLEHVVGREFAEVRVCGGPSASNAFCQLLANEFGKKVVSGPQEATILGNLAMQFRADSNVIQRSFSRSVYEPQS